MGIITGTALAATSIASGVMSAKAAGGAARDQRRAAEEASSITGNTAREARGITRGAAEQYADSLGILSPYQQLGAEGRKMLGKYLGIETLTTEPPPFEEGHLEDLQGRLKQLKDEQNFIWKNKFGGEYDKYRPRLMEMEREIPAIEGEIARVGRAMQAYQAKQAAAARVPSVTMDPDFGRALRPGPELKRFSMADFEADPGYEFRRGEGMRDLTNQFGSQGQLLSGNTLRSLSQFNQDYSSGEYQKAYERDLGYQQEAYARDIEMKNRLLGISSDLIDRGERATGARVAGNASVAALRGDEAGIVERAGQAQAGRAQDIGNISAAERVAKAQAYSDLFSGTAFGLGSAADSYMKNRVRKTPVTPTTRWA